MTKNFQWLFLVMITIFISCKDNAPKNKDQQDQNHELERKAIIETLNNETKAAFQRDYEGWTSYWVHDPNISKTYMNFTDSSYSESIGWDKISSFVKSFIEEHPEPEPVPKLVDDINVRFYDKGAWVSYEQQDSLRGLKRETRLMEKVNGRWRIAGMHTSIYGFAKGK